MSPGTVACMSLLLMHAVALAVLLVLIRGPLIRLYLRGLVTPAVWLFFSERVYCWDAWLLEHRSHPLAWLLLTYWRLWE